MVTVAKWELQFEPQHRIFVFKIHRALHRNNNKIKAKPFDLLRVYFFCTFCKYGLVKLNSLTTNYLPIKLSSFEKSWVPKYAEHYLYFDDENELTNEEACSKADVIDLCNSKRDKRCQHSPMLARLIISASNGNFTLKLRRNHDYLDIPRLLSYSRITEFQDNKYSSPILRQYRYVSIVYCFNLRRDSVAQTNMWTKYVFMENWGMIGLTLVLLSILSTCSDCQKKSFVISLKHVQLFLSSFLKLMRLQRYQIS